MYLSRIWIRPAALQLHPFSENGIWKAGRKMFSGMVTVGWRQGLKFWELCVYAGHSAADEHGSEIPTPLWGRFLLQGFSLGIWSADPKYDFSVSLSFANPSRAICANTRVGLAAAWASEEGEFVPMALYWICWCKTHLATCSGGPNLKMLVSFFCTGWSRHGHL